MREELAWVEISRDNLLHNVQVLSEAAGGLHRFCAVVKGDAYGHGLTTIVPLLRDAGVMKYAVYHPEEALKVRTIVGESALVMLLGFAEQRVIPDMVKANVQCLLLNKSRLQVMHDAIPVGQQLCIHVKVNTGMNRFGLQLGGLDDFRQELKKYPRLRLTGAATHYANAWSLEDRTYADGQYQRFLQAQEKLSTTDSPLDYLHMCNTSGMLNHPDSIYSFARVGIGLYGYYPSQGMKTRFDADLQLRPVLSFKTRIVSLREIDEGAYAGYDIAFRATRPTTIALAPAGYSDGFPFAHSDKGAFVLVNGQRAALIGRVNMNAIFFDVTDIPGLRIGDEVTILGKDGSDQVSVWDWMSWGTPHLYESLTKIRSGLARIVVA